MGASHLFGNTAKIKINTLDSEFWLLNSEFSINQWHFKSPLIVLQQSEKMVVFLTYLFICS
ncbi:hypothetical protein BV372_22160 [Nostoc sp. T09]|nr:hypothetical protein BV372_22160 [Nostoc sp. T09]